MAPVVYILLSAGITIVSFAAVRARAQPRPVDEQCGRVLGWDVPPPPAGFQLVQVNAIIRQAATRSRVHLYLLNRNIEKCTLSYVAVVYCTMNRVLVM